jgi:hypothetical protein
MQEAIEIGYQAFVSDGGEEFGAVREVSPNGRPELVIYVENAGDFVVPLSAVEARTFPESHFDLQQAGPSPAPCDRPRTRRGKTGPLSSCG